jgi:Uma2 family endonuclease
LVAKDRALARLQPKGLPLLYEDEGLEMGESSVHTRTSGILLYGLGFHLGGRAKYRVFGNLNLYYSDVDPNAYISPDVMIVEPVHALPEEVNSLRLAKDCSTPLAVAEVLSARTYQQGDLTSKPILYARLGIQEYVLVDVTGKLLRDRLVLLRRRARGSWSEQRDADGGVTSRLGFRVILDRDGQVRVGDARTGKIYARPEEAQAVADALAAETENRRQAEERVRALENELKRRGKKGRNN